MILYVPVLFHPLIEGRIAIVTDVGVECGGRGGADRRPARFADGRSRVVLARPC